MLKESDILFEQGRYWVIRSVRGYTVLQTGATHSISIQDFASDADGLSLAVAYAKYKANREANK